MNENLHPAALDDTRLPGLLPGAHGELPSLIARARSAAPLVIAVVHPCDATSLVALAALGASPLGAVIEPLIVAPRAKVLRAADDAAIDLSTWTIEDVPHSHAAAARAVELAAAGHAGALMKGSLHTDELMGAVVAADSGLRTDKRMSHCFLIET
ncbi:MAG: phosphate acetyl/butaryl transferase, partial [Burkholderia sp.]|nr:phosphate acetyl/butaryl transferase [Burkholderia sp.]